MSLAGGQRPYLSRWTISAAVVVLAHVGIAGAVLTWRKVIAPQELPGPVVVNLTPEPPVPAPSPTESAPVISKAAPEQPNEQVQDKRDDGTASKGGERIEQKPAEQPSVTAPVTISPSESAKTELGDAKTGTGGAAPARQADRSSGNPIDMINPGLPSNQGAKPNDRQKALKNLLTRLARHTLGHHPPSVAFRSVARNAIGALEDDRTGFAGANGLPPAQGSTNSVGRTATNAIGATVVLNPNVAGPSAGSRPAGSLASNSIAPATSGISGTGWSRPGAGNGTIGGAAKTVTGGINGTSFRPR